MALVDRGHHLPGPDNPLAVDDLKLSEQPAALIAEHDACVSFQESLDGLFAEVEPPARLDLVSRTGRQHVDADVDPQPLEGDGQFRDRAEGHDS